MAAIVDANPPVTTDSDPSAPLPLPEPVSPRLAARRRAGRPRRIA
jgi:hypothetical protein